MSILTIINEFSKICADLHSEKILNRNKAADRLNCVLGTCKADLIAFYRLSRNDCVSFTDIFNSVLGAIIRHSAKIEESKDTKSFQALRKRNDIYISIIDKMVDYSIEDNNNFLSKHILLNSFFEGYETRYVVKHFGTLFIKLLQDGIYKSSLNTSELKVDEFKRILTLLFEVNIPNDENLKFSTLRAMSKTIELAQKHVQLNDTLIDYLVTAEALIVDASKEHPKEETVKLCMQLCLFLVSQLAVDYHESVCTHLQKIFPIICGYYSFRMKTESKELFFKLTKLCLKIIYINVPEDDFTPFNPAANETWKKCQRILMTAVETEIKERKIQLCKGEALREENCKHAFIKMSALLVCLNYWGHNEQSDDNDIPSRTKIHKINDKIEVILQLVQRQPESFNELWLAISAELISKHEFVLNISNLREVLEAAFSILQRSNTGNHLKYVRLYLISVYKIEQKLIEAKSIKSDFLSKIWKNISEFTVNNTQICNEAIQEHQYLLQSLVKCAKLNKEQQLFLINFIISNKAMQRNEYIRTIHQILSNTVVCVEKSYNLMSKIISWLYESNTKLDLKSMLQHVDPLDVNLVAETSLFAVVNILYKSDSSKTEYKSIERFNQLLMYKNFHKYVCIEEYVVQIPNLLQSNAVSSEYSKLCVLQTSYEFLMKVLNFEPSQNLELSTFLKDLKHLETMSILMNKFLEYKIFDEGNYLQCPLMKRVGLFLSRLEFLFKNSGTILLSATDLLEIFFHVETIFNAFLKNKTLLTYLMEQDLNALIDFIAKTLKVAEPKKLNDGIETDTSRLSIICQKMLAALFASSTHYDSAFTHLRGCDFFIKYESVNVLSVIEIICQQKTYHEKVANWLVENFKLICKLHHKNIESSQKIVDIMPDIFLYVNSFADLLHDMLIALSSFVKKACLKSYPVDLTANLILSLRYIAKNCPKLCESEDFLNICCSFTKFLQSSSIKIQCASINTITALLDLNWIISDKSTDLIKSHLKFCNKIYKLLESRNFQEISDDKDLEANINAMSVQMYTSLFAFSSYHKDEAIQKIVHLCVIKHLNKNNFRQFNKIAAFFTSNLNDLMKPYISNMIQKWIKANHPILEFPFFLCSQDIISFIRSNLQEILFSILFYGNVCEISKLEHLNIEKQDLIEIAIPKCLAVALVHLSDNNMKSISNDYHDNMKNLINNLKLADIDILSQNIKLNSQTLISVVELIDDLKNFQQLFGYELCFQSKKMQSINVDTLKEILKFYINSCYASRLDITNCFALLMKNDANILIRLLAELKLRIISSIFLNDRLKSIHMYCILVDITFDTIAENNLNNFFLKDIVYFILNLFTENKASFQILRGILHFFRCLLKKLISVDIMKSFFSDIVYVLVTLTKKPLFEEIQKQTIDLLQHVICDMKFEINDVGQSIDMFPQTQKFETIRNFVQNSLSMNQNNCLTFDIRKILQKANISVDDLKSMKNSIITHKEELSHKKTDSKMLCSLLKKLIDIIRNDSQICATEAAICLGEIGGIKLEGSAYYFQADATFYDLDTLYRDENNILAKCLSTVLERIFLQYNSKTHIIVCEVSEQLVNSKFCQILKESSAYLKVFDSKDKRSVLDNSIAPIDFVAILKSTEHLYYGQWVKKFSSEVFNLWKWTGFQYLSTLDESFAENSIIAAFKLFATNGKQHMIAVISVLEYFFKECFSELTNGEETHKVLYREKRAMKVFLFICECIRIQNEWKLPINLLHVAKAGIYCQANFMAILYLEMLALDQKLNFEKCKSEIVENVTFQEVAVKVYESVGCSEAISAFLNPLKSRLEFLNLEGNWADVILEADAAKDTNNLLFNHNLKRNGLYQISKWNQQNQQVNYESCWRLCDWDTSVDEHSELHSATDMEYELEKYHFFALKSIYNREENNCIAAISKARNCVITILKEISVECLQSIYKYLTWLHLLQQAEDFCQVQFRTSNVDHIFKKWEIETDMTYGNFDCKERTLSHQLTLFKIAGVRATRKINQYYKEQNIIGNCLLKCIEECKNNGAINLAIRNVVVLKNINISEQLQVNVLLEDAKLCQRTGKTLIAKEILKYITSNRDFGYCLKRIEAYRIYGEHLVDTNEESFDVVLKKYFNGSIDLLNNYITNKDRILKKDPYAFTEKSFAFFEQKHRKKTFETIAKYADREYNQLNTYCKSDVFQTKLNIIKQNKQDVKSLASQGGKDREKAIKINVVLKNCVIDEDEIRNVKLKRSENLCIAAENYINFCKFDEAISSPAIYRIITLWFANKHDTALNDKIGKYINDIPSYKFLCALNQITARLAVKDDVFLKTLKQIIARCIEDHPQHTLPKILALMSSDSNKDNVDEDRVKISKDIINKAKNTQNENCMKQMENIFAALIDFANTDPGKAVSFCLSEKLKRLKNQNSVQCLTVDLPISINQKYSLTSIVKWEEKVTLVGGINAPKKLICLCSDGRKRPQLLKGRDDLRQDAVMQQVLSMVNDLLNKEQESREQKLSIRTYKVVPLSMRSGILEWCENTIPLGTFLIEAHKKYRPNDYSITKCRELSKNHLRHSFDKRHEIYTKICNNIKPVFHYFFYERFPTPGIWFERRLAYTNSVATSSIVGFVLGIGDRHTQNILIDEKTGEVIHIDFGIAFEQGKIMPTPETVPFRLTRDIVSPMGICEVDGIFKKSCEKTMTILRRNQVVIVTILEVLLYDPLYIWKIPTENVSSSNEIQNDKKNLTAERALMRVEEKLEGRDETKLGTTGVDVHVQRLVNEAMNVRNLCRLYPGWDPYL